MKDLIRNLTLLGTLFLLQSLPGSAQLMVKRASGFDDIPAAQSSLRNAIDDFLELTPLSSSSLVDAGTLDSDDPIPDDFANGARSHPALYMQPEVPVPRDTKFGWRFATRESLLFTGIMHAFNLTTEAGTRDTLNGHWFKNYTRSVSELRGWSDSDRFMAPYVGHTIEGSVFGYIERQNDPKYRNVQWGDGRDYFVSLLRSLAFSAVWHTQWKIGPISEASIGNVMLHASPGFITLTDTPTLGTVEMIGEDAADRYLIMGLENRTANRILISLARSFLNPGRSMSNIMAFQIPWHRETRPGVWGENFVLRKELLEGYKKTGEKPFEFAPRFSPNSGPPRLSARGRYRTYCISLLSELSRRRELCRWRRLRRRPGQSSLAGARRGERMPHYAHTRIQSEWRLLILWWWNALDSAGLPSHIAVCTGTVRGGLR